MGDRVATLEAQVAALTKRLEKTEKKHQAVETVSLGYRPSFKKQGLALEAIDQEE